MKTTTFKKIFNIKAITLIIILFSFSSAWSTSFIDKQNRPIDSCLVVFNEKDKLTILQGERIFVRVGEQKYNGIFKYSTDSTIFVDNDEINLAAIDVIAKYKKKKTVGMFFAQLPVSIVGFAIMAVSSAYGDAGGTIGGVALIGVGLGGATFESYRGKRYRAYKKHNEKKPKERNWEYSTRELFSCCP